MNKIFLYTICFFIAIYTSNAQGNYPVKVNQNAHYPKGETALAEYFLQNINYSPEAIKNKIQGNVILSFTVNTDSTISNIIPLSNLGYGIEEEVTRCLKNLKYAPAIVNGIPYPANLIINVAVRAEEKRK